MCMTARLAANCSSRLTGLRVNGQGNSSDFWKGPKDLRGWFVLFFGKGFKFCISYDFCVCVLGFLVSRTGSSPGWFLSVVYKFRFKIHFPLFVCSGVSGFYSRSFWFLLSLPIAQITLLLYGLPLILVPLLTNTISSIFSFTGIEKIMSIIPSFLYPFSCLLSRFFNSFCKLRIPTELLGSSAQKVTRNMKYPPNTIYSWRSKYKRISASEAKCLKTLEEEKARLKRLWLKRIRSSGSHRNYLKNL